jgi:hypothetical protein
LLTERFGMEKRLGFEGHSIQEKRGDAVDQREMNALAASTDIPPSLRSKV